MVPLPIPTPAMAMAMAKVQSGGTTKACEVGE